jgi:hypothetical protein
MGLVSCSWENGRDKPSTAIADGWKQDRDEMPRIVDTLVRVEIVATRATRNGEGRIGPIRLSTGESFDKLKEFLRGASDFGPNENWQYGQLDEEEITLFCERGEQRRVRVMGSMIWCFGDKARAQGRLPPGYMTFIEDLIRANR